MMIIITGTQIPGGEGRAELPAMGKGLKLAFTLYLWVDSLCFRVVFVVKVRALVFAILRHQTKLFSSLILSKKD